jgi:hypothetical protein
MIFVEWCYFSISSGRLINLINGPCMYKYSILGKSAIFGDFSQRLMGQTRQNIGPMRKSAIFWFKRLCFSFIYLTVWRRYIMFNVNVNSVVYWQTLSWLFMELALLQFIVRAALTSPERGVLEALINTCTSHKNPKYQAQYSMKLFWNTIRRSGSPF